MRFETNKGNVCVNWKREAQQHTYTHTSSHTYIRTHKHMHRAKEFEKSIISKLQNSYIHLQLFMVKRQTAFVLRVRAKELQLERAGSTQICERTSRRNGKWLNVSMAWCERCQLPSLSHQQHLAAPSDHTTVLIAHALSHSLSVALFPCARSVHVCVWHTLHTTHTTHTQLYTLRMRDF